MDTRPRYLCTLACPGVEVVTHRTPTGWRTRIHGGPLDGEEFVSDSHGQHEVAVDLAKTAADEDAARACLTPFHGPWPDAPKSAQVGPLALRGPSPPTYPVLELDADFFGCNAV